MAQILDDWDAEWEFINHHIQIQKTWWTTFVKPTKREEIREDQKWAADITKLVALYTKISMTQAQLREEQAKYDIKEYTWQKPPKNKIGKKRQKLLKYVREYLLLKQRFVKEHKELG